MGKVRWMRLLERRDVWSRCDGGGEGGRRGEGECVWWVGGSVGGSVRERAGDGRKVKEGGVSVAPGKRAEGGIEAVQSG
jgi:hypothetical protein